VWDQKRLRIGSLAHLLTRTRGAPNAAFSYQGSYGSDRDLIVRLLRPTHQRFGTDSVLRLDNLDFTLRLASGRQYRVVRSRHMRSN
jgi:hypothetical protein